MRRKTIGVALLLVGASTLGSVAIAGSALTAAASAATTCLVVNTRLDQSYPRLQDAMRTAIDGDTLFVKGTCPGHTVITKNLTIKGQTRRTAILDGGGVDVPSGSVLTICGAHVTLTSLQVEGGTGTTTEALCGGNLDTSGRFGGGIAEDQGILTLNDSSVHNNSVPPDLGDQEGGGIFSAHAVVTLNNSSVYGNTSGEGAGGVGLDAAILTLNGGSSVNDNSSPNGSAGGIADDGQLTLNDTSSVYGNTSASAGGGITVNFGAALELNDQTAVHDNKGDQGGGVFNGGGGVTMNGSSSINGNTATEGGGGVFNLAEGGLGTLTMNDSSSIHNNLSLIGGGGGIFNQGGTLSGTYPAPVTTCSTGVSGFNVYCNAPDNIFP